MSRYFYANAEIISAFRFTLSVHYGVRMVVVHLHFSRSTLLRNFPKVAVRLRLANSVVEYPVYSPRNFLKGRPLRIRFYRTVRWDSSGSQEGNWRSAHLKVPTISSARTCWLASLFTTNSRYHPMRTISAKPRVVALKSQTIFQRSIVGARQKPFQAPASQQNVRRHGERVVATAQT